MTKRLLSRRLWRHPGEQFQEPRVLGQRLFARDVERKPRVEVAEHMTIEPSAIRSMRNLARTEPNAPQLIRLNRHPFALATTHVQKAHVRPTLSLDYARLEERPAPMIEGRASCGVLFGGIPVRSIDHRPATLSLGGNVDAWLSGGANP